MAEPRLGPDELDRLEDALEDLEFRDDFSDPSDAVSQRLADFQAILQASREALPLEEVRPGLLDGVLAEARLSAEDIRAPATQPGGESFWSRFRSSWLIPSLAVAGTAALVLLLVQPTLTAPDAEEAVGAVAVNEAPASPSPAAAPVSADEEPEKALADEAPAAAPPAASSRAGPPGTKQDAFAADVEIPAGIEAAESEPEAEPEAEPAPAQEVSKAGEKKAPSQGWNAIEDGDASRKGGDCFTARNHYARALDDGNDSVRARAYVGMGLCKREEGNEAAAQEYFDQARELDEDALDFAGTQSKERRKKPAPRRPRKKASGKRKSPIDFDEASDPFSGQ